MNSAKVKRIRDLGQQRAVVLPAVVSHTIAQLEGQGYDPPPPPTP
jgi:hypothetical protein